MNCIECSAPDADSQTGLCVTCMRSYDVLQEYYLAELDETGGPEYDDIRRFEETSELPF